MRTHGWGGSPPKDDAEAISRIRQATHDCVAQFGSATSISHVAARLAVTRQTVYRYFPSTADLLISAAIEGTGPFLDSLSERLATLDDPGKAVVEAIVATLEAVPTEPYLQLLLGAEGWAVLLRNVTGKSARGVGRQLLERAAVDWPARGYTSEALDELSEWTLRVMQSFLIDTGEPAREPAQVRGYLNRWFAPAISSGPPPVRALNASV